MFYRFLLEIPTLTLFARNYVFFLSFIFTVIARRALARRGNLKFSILFTPLSFGLLP